MDLNQLKELWNKEQISETPEISLEQQKEIHSPLQMIRRNMKTEFWMNIGMFPLMIIAFIPSMKGDIESAFIMGLIFLLMFTIVGYYTYRFYQIYKKISLPSFNTNYDLFNLKTELLVSKEMYKSYYIAFIPLFFALMMSLVKFKMTVPINIFIFLISFGFGITITYVIGKVWLREMYGKYINEVVYLIDELNGIDVSDRRLKNKSRKFPLFEKSKQYFTSHFGSAGVWINTILWTMVSVALLLILSFLLGFGIGYLSVKFNLLEPFHF